MRICDHCEHLASRLVFTDHGVPLYFQQVCKVILPATKSYKGLSIIEADSAKPRPRSCFRIKG